MPLTPVHASSTHRNWLFAALLVGLALRILFYLDERSLWLDEALVSMNIADRGWAELWEPLEGEQAAPPLFLWAMKAATVVGGLNEFMLRLPALLGSIGALLLMPTVARRLQSPKQQIFTTALWALLPAAVLYGAEAKPYGADACFTLLVLWLALRWREDPSWKKAITLAGVGSLSLWFSYPLAFVLGGIGLGLAAEAMTRRRKGLPQLGLCAALWLGSFAGLWGVIAQATAQEEAFATYWQSSFLPLVPTSARELGLLVQGLFGLVLAPFSGRYAHPSADFGLYAAGLAAALALAGGLRLLREQRPLLIALLLPILLTAVASSLQLYPFRGRFLLGLAPIVVLLLGLGVRERAIAAVTLGLAALPSSQLLVRPIAAPQTRLALQQLANEMQPGDRLLIHSHSLAAVLFYEQNFEECRLPEHERLISASPAEGIGGGFRAGAELPTDRTTWFLFETEWQLEHPMGYVGAGVESRGVPGDWSAHEGSQILRFQ